MAIKRRVKIHFPFIQESFSYLSTNEEIDFCNYFHEQTVQCWEEVSLIRNSILQLNNESLNEIIIICLKKIRKLFRNKAFDIDVLYEFLNANEHKQAINRNNEQEKQIKYYMSKENISNMHFIDLDKSIKLMEILYSSEFKEKNNRYIHKKFPKFLDYEFLDYIVNENEETYNIIGVSLNLQDVTCKLSKYDENSERMFIALVINKKENLINIELFPLLVDWNHNIYNNKDENHPIYKIGKKRLQNSKNLARKWKVEINKLL